ncbi:AAA family ATPase [Piscinibacter terrae]|uniref:AAA family ATPase n=1 Tax=Piscinibacter terrae TaxID=2496871 RepID=UPI001F356294|nr:ATP-binding protein [Albitalea terrae]
MKPAFVIGILGAESTGKTLLSSTLRDALSTGGRRVAVVSEYLREFCDLQGRTPIEAEQAGIAAEQSHRIDEAAQTHDIVIADTTALMIAVYSEIVFGDTSLYASAIEAHRRCGITLLTALDIPWQADAHQRDGPHVREPVDALVRAALLKAQLPYAVVSGSGERRLESALLAVKHALDESSSEDEARANPLWKWVCERCGDANCERHLLPRIG